WTTDEQATWLTERVRRFTDAQADGTTRPFFNATTESWVVSWPVDPPTAEDIAKQDGDEEAAKREKFSKLRSRIEWWFRNHTRANSTGSTNKSKAVLSLTRKRTQPLMPYQAYMHL
ncbi:hypothetical protein K466DRAFT_451983, partial [Polyporus arcularius HHB13444]